MFRVLQVMLGMLLATAAARASPYWIEYEPASGRFPEDPAEGWQRIIYGGGAQRWFDDGALVIDGLASRQIADFYRMYRPGALDPGPGELFVVQWRLLVDKVIGSGDPDVTVFSDDAWAVAFMFNEDALMSVLEPGLSAPFEPYVYHEFELRSWDMRSYDLFIDGQPAMAGSFHHLVSRSEVFWGDGAQGSASLSHWDYFRFGAVPEPASSVLVAASGSLFLLNRFRGGARRSAPAVRKGFFHKEIASCHGEYVQ